MTHHRVAAGSRSCQGFSLIELMVSMIIGLIISIAAVSAYLSASGASRMAEAQGRMNEDAQAALTILTQQLRMAGNNPDQVNRIDNDDPTLSSRHNPVYLPMPTSPGFTTTFALTAFGIRGCDGVFSNITAAPALDQLLCAPDDAQPDSIAVSYEADTFNTVPTPGNLPTDCLGIPLTSNTAFLPTLASSAAVNATVTYAVADNRFYIGTSAAIPSLYCKGNGINSTPQALVENIEDIQFTYGTVSALTPNETLTIAPVAGYLSANEITSLAALTDAERWAKVITVRICVLVRSEGLVAPNSASAQYRKCDGTLEAAPPDLRLRRAYSTTVVLRNRRL